MTLTRLTQKQRILLALRKHGAKGIDLTMFQPPNVCDGGKPIARVAARIHELRDEGFPIHERGRRHQCSVYVLDERKLERTLAAPVERPGPPSSSAPAGALFDPSIGAEPPRSAYDDLEAA